MNKKFLLVATLLACAYPFVSHADAAVDEVQQVQALQAENSRTIHVETAGTLSTLITVDEIKQLSELKVTGEINKEDTNFVKNILPQSTSSISLDFSDATYLSGSWEFNYCLALVDIKLPKGVTELAYCAFEGCSSLISIFIPESVTSIGRCAFKKCSSLANITIPKGVTTINDQTFEDCTNLSDITIPESVTSIKYEAFRMCINLKTAHFESVESIFKISYGGDWAKLGVEQIYIGEAEEPLQELIIPSTVSHIESGLIRSPYIKSIFVPDEVTEIASSAFEALSNLRYVTIEGTPSIGDAAFNCPNLETFEFKSPTLPKITGTKTIAEQAIIIVPEEAYDDYCAHPSLERNALLNHIIAGRTMLFRTIDVTAMNSSSGILNAMGEKGMANVYDLTLKGSINGYDIMMIRNKMPNLKHLDLTDAEIVANPYEYYEGCHTEDHRLGRRTFEGMTNLVNVKLPKTITAIDERAFYNCTRLKNVIIQPGVVAIDREAFLECSALESIDIPSTVKTLGGRCFRECTGLSEVSLHEGLLSIGEDAFVMNSFEYLSIPTTVERIEHGAFSYCRRMKEVVLPPRLKAIEGSTFYSCSALEKIHIPPMVERIEGGAFNGSYKEHVDLKDVYVYVANSKDLSISQDAFTCWSTATLHVPSFGYADYYMNTQWGQFAHLEKFDEPYETFYTKNTLTLDSNTGIIDGTPDALFYEHGSLEVNDNEVQPLDEVTLVHDGKDGASLIPEQTGNITVETLGIDINVRANSWHFFSFPFDIDLASIKYDGDYVWRQYDGAKRSRREGGWQNLAAGTTVLKAGRGYIFQGTTAGVLHLEVSHPEITADNVNTELKTYATADTDPADASWNFIGNPYTSYYAVDEATYAAPITIWTGNGYEAYRPGDDDYEFAPYEAFFVQTPTGTSAVNFNADNREGYEEMQAAQSQRRMARAQKKVNPNRLLVNLELGVQGDPSAGSGTSEYLDKTRVVFNDNCSLDYESDCDAAKFFSEERRAELYTIGTDGTQYAINERPEDGGYVDLGFVANQKGKYTISAQRMDVPMLLIDDVMETTFDLRNGAYEFSSAKGTFNKRFSLKRYEGITTSIKDLADQIGMTFSISDGSISVDGLDASTRVSLYNTAGQQIATQQGNGTLSAIPGTYVISVGKLTAKVIVK